MKIASQLVFGLTVFQLCMGTCLAQPIEKAGATPQQVGLYQGTISTTLTQADGTRSKQTSSMLIEIASDAKTTVTVGGIQKPTASAAYLPTEAIIVFGDSTSNPVNIILGTMHFKNGSIKGSGSGHISNQIAGPPTTFQLIASQQVRFKLKKIL